jgi:hypothetical protein
MQSLASYWARVDRRLSISALTGLRRYKVEGTTPFFLGSVDETRNLCLGAHTAASKRARAAISSSRQHPSDIATALSEIAASSPPARSDLAKHAAKLHREKYYYFLPDELLKVAIAKVGLDSESVPSVARRIFNPPTDKLLLETLSVRKLTPFVRKPDQSPTDSICLNVL